MQRTTSRRRLLAATAAAGLGGLAGCTARSVGGDGGSDGATEPTRRPSTPVDPGSLAANGNPSTICSAPIVSGIRAIVEPAFASDWSAVEPDNEFVYGEPTLDDERTVVGVVADGAARAYPIDAFWRHEVVNDEFGGPILVTYCPLCRSGMVASRVVDGETLTFDASGQLWVPPEIYTRSMEQGGDVFVAGSRGLPGEDESVRNTANLVLYDVETESYWSQLLATAICGPHTDTQLAIRASILSTWGEWRTAHPGTDVLLPAPHSRLIE
ncbi:DUF3179 domain-containing (seleno)protein [Haloarchaeobius baliensis]|uniref:DUF3179 domain-containing (seleno)protein n=1 Tax=Haloarchaeobius baliensis TaxID=1670458 RepID=UPI003F884CDA